MSSVKAAGVFGYMPSVCAYAHLCVCVCMHVWPKHIIMHHLLEQEVAMCGLSLITGLFGQRERIENDVKMS